MKISCIIPAFNEAERIINVLNVLVHHPLVDEVIVVNDASTDNTRIALEARSDITLINHEKNKGKTQAVLTGIQKAKHSMVMLIDSDLIGLSEEAITNLIEPILNDQADVTISLRKNALSIYRVAGIDFVSGERVFHKNLLTDFPEELQQLPGFGLEVFMNNITISKNLRLKIIPWNNVISPRKSVKKGIFIGSCEDAKMVFQILSTVSLWTCIYQVYKMKKLSLD